MFTSGIISEHEDLYQNCAGDCTSVLECLNAPKLFMFAILISLIGFLLFKVKISSEEE